ncbi:hypothetical protein Tco_0468528 [Tanacetum coccineum]
MTSMRLHLSTASLMEPLNMSILALRIITVFPVADGVQWVYPLNGIHQSYAEGYSSVGLFSAEPSAGILLSELADSSGH